MWLSSERGRPEHADRTVETPAEPEHLPFLARTPREMFITSAIGGPKMPDHIFGTITNGFSRPWMSPDQQSQRAIRPGELLVADGGFSIGDVIVEASTLRLPVPDVVMKVLATRAWTFSFRLVATPVFRPVVRLPCGFASALSLPIDSIQIKKFSFGTRALGILAVTGLGL